MVVVEQVGVAQHKYVFLQIELNLVLICLTNIIHTYLQPNQQSSNSVNQPNWTQGSQNQGQQSISQEITPNNQNIAGQPNNNATSNSNNAGELLGSYLSIKS